MEYKTPELQRLLYHLCKQYPKYKGQLLEFEPRLANVNLSQHDEAEETYCQSINLVTGEAIKLIWNIDQLIEFSKMHSDKLQIFSPLKILFSDKFDIFNDENSQIYNAVYKSIKLNIDYVHKISYIIIAQPLFVSGYCIIDGNHRFFEALIKNQPVKCFFISGTDCTRFLQPESQKYIQIFSLINEVIQK